MPYIQFKDLEMFYEKIGVNDPIIFLHSHYPRGILAFASQLLDFQKCPTLVTFQTSEVMAEPDVKVLNGVHLS
jgi:hypothetical protein